MISSIFTSIQKYLFKSALYKSIIEESIKKSALKKNIVNLLLLFSTELHVDTFKFFKCLKNILKTFIHLKTYDAFICKVSLFPLSFSSVQSLQSCLTLCNPMNCSTPGLPVHHQLPGFTQTHVHRVSDAIQSSHPLSSLSPLAPNPSQHQSLFQ